MRWIGVMLLALCGSAFAQTPEKRIEALSNVQMELSVCVAYFSIVKECAPESMKEEAKEFDRTIKYMTDMAYKIGAGLGMTTDAMLGRLQMAYEDQGKLLNKSCLNTASLYRRHAARCKQLGENMGSVLDEYLKK